MSSQSRMRRPSAARLLAAGLTLAVVALLIAGTGNETEPVTVTSPRYSPANADQWFTWQRTYPTGNRPTTDKLDVAMKSRPKPPSLRTALSLPGSTWVSIGPRPIHVQNTLPFAGRITAVAPHPTNASTIYIGADAGGIWRTTDAGATWASLTDDLPVPAIQSIAIDPVDPRLIYASTIQRTYPSRWLSSTDAGVTWTVGTLTLDDGRMLSPALCSVNVHKACIPPSSGRILIDPARAGSASTSTIYYVGASHLLRSDNSGQTFRPVLTLPVDLDFAGSAAPTLNPEAPYLRDVALDPTRPDILHAVVAQPDCVDTACDRVTSLISAYRSLDAGGHWTSTPLTTLGEYVLSDDLNVRYADPGAVYVPRARVAIAPSAPDTVAIAVRDVLLSRPRVFRSTNLGEAWTETTPSTGLTWPLAIAFSPSDANTLYVGSAGVARSTNGGQTWSALTPTHADNISITFTSAGTPLISSDGGLYRGTVGNSLDVLHRALPVTELYSVAAHPTNPLLLAAGAQDNGTLVFQSAVGWSLITGGDGGDTVWDPTPGVTRLYAEVEWASIDGSNVFAFFRCEIGSCVTRNAGLDLTLDGPFIPRMAMDPTNSSTIWLTVERLFRTDNRGDSWTAASPSVANDMRCWTDASTGRTCAPSRYFTAAAIAATASQTVYGGTLNGDVRLTVDGGVTWTSVAGTDAGPLPVRAVTDISVDPLNAQTAYVAYSGFDSGGSGTGHLFRTTDGGQTWTNLSGNLPDVPVNTILIDPDTVGSDSPVLYVGTDIGVYRATLSAGGAAPTWASFGTGLPPVVVTRLAYNTTTHQLLAATYGRGVWAISSRFGQ